MRCIPEERTSWTWIEKKEKNKTYAKERERRTISRRASRQGFAANPDEVQSPARNKYNRNPRLTSRIDNDLLPIERDTVDRSPSILLDRENPARSDEVADVRTRTRTWNPARTSTAAISRTGAGEGGWSVRGTEGWTPLLSSRSPTLARELPVGRLEDPPMNARSETDGIDSDEDDQEMVLQRTHRWGCAGRRGARARQISGEIPHRDICECPLWVHHRERTERKRSGDCGTVVAVHTAYARATQRRSSARRGGSITTDRRPCYHPPVRCSGSAADRRRRCRRPRPSPPPRTPYPSPRPFLVNHPSLCFLSRSLPLSSSSLPRLVSSPLLFSSLLLLAPLPFARHPLSSRCSHVTYVGAPDAHHYRLLPWALAPVIFDNWRHVRIRARCLSHR